MGTHDQIFREQQFSSPDEVKTLMTIRETGTRHLYSEPNLQRQGLCLLDTSAVDDVSETDSLGYEADEESDADDIEKQRTDVRPIDDYKILMDSEGLHVGKKRDWLALFHQEDVDFGLNSYEPNPMEIETTAATHSLDELSPSEKLNEYVRFLGSGVDGVIEERRKHQDYLAWFDRFLSTVRR